MKFVTGLAGIRFGLAAQVLLLALLTATVLLTSRSSYLLAAASDDSESKSIDFNRQIKPILSEYCYKCHGPDPGARKAGLRLDIFEGATAETKSGSHAIVPGDSANSEVVYRTSTDDPFDQMPPPDQENRPSAEEVELIRQWIDQGAEWLPHWSFITPKRSKVPVQVNSNWSRNAIDNFILEKINSEGMEPGEEAKKETLIRRVTLDLTGLPPTLEEIDTFLADDSDDAYEKIVDRLLVSPRYGEHMTRYWLDAARYGDTHGLHLDNERSIWRWRDWVINAYNSNMPFDQFTVEQLAGDLLPNPTRDQLIATGFNRNNVTTSEGGAIDAEYLVKYAVDRVETTSTVWLGITAGCAVCHDHKFDPFTQKEFYQMFAFFNNITEKAMDGNQHNPPPSISAPTVEQEAKLAEYDAKVIAISARIDEPMPEVDHAQKNWEDKWRDITSDRWEVLKPKRANSPGGTTLEILEDDSILASGENPPRDTYHVVYTTDLSDIKSIRLDALTHESLPFNGPGRADNANFVLSEFEAEVISIADPENRRRIEFSAVAADHSQANGEYFIEKSIDGILDNTNGWAVEGFNKRENRKAIYTSKEPFGYEGGTEIHLLLHFETHFTKHGIGRFRVSISDESELYDYLSPAQNENWFTAGPFSQVEGEDPHNTVYKPEEDPASIKPTENEWVEHAEYQDGKIHKLTGEDSATYLTRNIYSPTDRAVDFSIGSDDSIKIWLNGKLLLDRKVARGVAADQDRFTAHLEKGDNRLLMKVVNIKGGYGFYFRKLPEKEGQQLAILTDIFVTDLELADTDKKQIREYYRKNHSPLIRELYDTASAIKEERDAFAATIPITLVMKELPEMERRKAYLLYRGEYDKPREEVEPNIPAALGVLSEDMPRNRLGLAQWLTSPEQPLTARVAVNRIWQQHFGTGIIKTSEDLGSQGEWPSHPELLDWLAVEFIESDWDVKHMHRLMVTSATYRQSSKIKAGAYENDPENRMLARGPRFRMEGEMIRDMALFVSGLLVEKIGGKSVKPYQPQGLWKAVGYPSSDTSTFTMDSGEDLFRRSLYTFWKRTSPPPNMMVFDAPSRETCTVRRARTNTPLQALVMMNDPQFLNAARSLAQRILTDAADSTESRITMAFRLVTSRRPTADELTVLNELFDEQTSWFENNEGKAEEYLMVVETESNQTLNKAELAAYTALCNTILMLDEALTRG